MACLKGVGSAWAISAAAIVVASCGAPAASSFAPAVHPQGRRAGAHIDCPEHRGDCDGDPANGCETDLDSDPDNCRACGHSCVPPDGALAGCFSGRCGLLSCPAGTCDLDGRVETGCNGILDCHGDCVARTTTSAYSYCY